MDKVGHNGVPDPLSRASKQSVASMMLTVGLVSASVLFIASLVAYLFIHFFHHVANAAPFPQLPGGLWVSTVLLLASSGTLHWALTAARRDNQGGLRTAMLVTLALGLAFLINQALNWVELGSAVQAWGQSNHVDFNALTPDPVAQWLKFHLLAFYFLTVLHAAHVLGGVIPMAVTTRNAFAGHYTRTSHSGVRLLSMYWHFLDVVWLILFVVLTFTLH